MKNYVFDKVKGIAPKKSWYLPGRPILSLRRFCFMFLLKWRRKQGLDYSYKMPQESNVPIDVFMPTLEKDAYTLNLAIDYLRKNVKHPISNIYIVSAEKSKKLKKLAAEKKCIFVDEKSVLDIDKQSINYSFNGFDKNGWIYKMLLNLNANKVCKERHILILDSDTLFILPQIFIYNDRPLFNLSDEYHQPYFDANKNILGIPHKISRSFITHYMLFDSQVLDEYHASLEERWSEPWYMAIIHNLDKSTAMAFADYESYGDFYLKRHPRQYYLNYWSNASHELKDISPEKLVKKALKHKVYRSVSLHTFSKQTLKDHEK